MSTELTAAWRQQIFEHHQASQRADKEFAQAILTKIEAVRQTGQLIRECRGELDRQQFESATDFLTDNAIREYVRFARREPIMDLDTAVHVIKTALQTTGALDFPSNGHGVQRLHRNPDFISEVIDACARLVDNIRRHLRSHSLRHWQTGEIEALLAGLAPLLAVSRQLHSYLDGQHN